MFEQKTFINKLTTGSHLAGHTHLNSIAVVPAHTVLRMCLILGDVLDNDVQLALASLKALVKNRCVEEALGHGQAGPSS